MLWWLIRPQRVKKLWPFLWPIRAPISRCSKRAYPLDVVVQGRQAVYPIELPLARLARVREAALAVEQVEALEVEMVAMVETEGQAMLARTALVTAGCPALVMADPGEEALAAMAVLMGVQVWVAQVLMAAPVFGVRMAYPEPTLAIFRD